MVLFSDFDLTFCRVRVLAFQLLKIAPVFLGDGMVIDDHRMRGAVGIEYESLAIMLGQIVVEGVVLPYLTGETVELTVNQETAKVIIDSRLLTVCG